MRANKANMGSKETIEKLSKELKPVKPLQTPEKRVLIWSVIALFILIVVMVKLPIRKDAHVRIKDWLFIAQMGTLMLFSISASLTALKSSIPGNMSQGSARLSKILATLLFLTFILIAYFTEFRYHLLLPHHASLKCAALVITASLIPLIVILWQTKKGVIFHTRIPLYWAILAASSIGILAIQLICSDMAFSHQTVWHLTPAALLLMLAWVIPNRD